MITYTLTLTEWQFKFLRWVSQGCPENDMHDLLQTNSGLRSIKKLHAEGLITWNPSASLPQSEVWKITPKGLAAIVLGNEFLGGKNEAN